MSLWRNEKIEAVSFGKFKTSSAYMRPVDIGLCLDCRVHKPFFPDRRGDGKAQRLHGKLLCRGVPPSTVSGAGIEPKSAYYRSFYLLFHPEPAVRERLFSHFPKVSFCFRLAAASLHCLCLYRRISESRDSRQALLHPRSMAECGGMYPGYCSDRRDFVGAASEKVRGFLAANLKQYNPIYGNIRCPFGILYCRRGIFISAGGRISKRDGFQTGGRWRTPFQRKCGSWPAVI